MTEKDYPENLKALLLEFAKYQKGVRRGTDSTLEAYFHDLDTYFEYMRSEKLDLSKLVFDELMMCGFVIFLRDRHNADSTIQRRFDGVYAFCYFLYKRHGFGPPLTIKDCGIRLKKQPPTQPIRHDEYIEFMRSIKNELSRIK